MPSSRPYARALVILAVLLLSCRPTSPIGTPPQLVSLTVTPEPSADDRLARLPTFALVFDRALAPPSTDAIWLLSGIPGSTLRTDVLHATLRGANVAARIPVTIGWDPAHPEQLQVTPVAALAPDTELTLAPTVQLTGTEGAPVDDVDGSQLPWLRTYQVAPAYACPPIARLGFPLADVAPTSLTYARVDFDRPVWPWGDLPSLVDAAGTVLDADVALGCGDDGSGYGCVTFALRGPLVAQTAYHATCDSLADDAGLTPQCDETVFTASDDTPPAPGLAAETCATDEQPVDVFCVRNDARAVRVRSALTADGAIEVRATASTADSGSGTDVVASLRGLQPDTLQTLLVTVRAMDGTEILARPLDGVITASPPPPLRITEVLAHAHSSTAQTFVEVLNEGSASLGMGGLQLVTSHGAQTLPDATLPAGSRAVIVGVHFDPEGAVASGDPPVAPDTVVVTLAHALAVPEHGSDVWIADADGHALSRVPLASLAIRTGVSFVRADARMAEDDPASWAYDAEGSATPGAADRVR